MSRPQRGAISTISEEYESGSDFSGAGHPRGGSSVRYIVTDPNDVQFIEQSKNYPTVNAASNRNSANIGFVNSAYVNDENNSQLSSAAAARAARRSRRRMRRQQQLEATVSPDTSSDDVAPYVTEPYNDQKRGIIKEKPKERRFVQNGDVLDDGCKTFHLKKKGEAGYGFAYRNGKVSVVVPGSEADKVGLCVGDKIVEVNGVAIEGQDKDGILEKISRNKKNLILVVLDENFTGSETSDLNESGSELSDSVDRSSGSSVRFQIDGRMNPLKPGESVASLDMVPARSVVNFDPNPQPKRSRRHHGGGSQRGSNPPNHPQYSGGSLRRHQSPHRSSGRGSQRSRSRSPAHSSRSRSPAHQPHSQRNGSLGRSSRSSMASSVDNANHYQYNNNKPAQLEISAITVQPSNEKPLPRDHLDEPDVKQRKGMCCGSYTMWAAFSMIFCLPCIPLGALAYVYAKKSTKAYAMHDDLLGEKLGTTAGYFVIAAILFGAMTWLGVLCAIIFASS